MTTFRETSAALCLAAASSMIIAPASAAEIATNVPVTSIPEAQQWDSNAVNADRYRRYRPHYRGRHYRRNRGIDAGDVLAGVLIVGGIAVLADAVLNNDRDDRYRRDDVRYRERTDDRRYNDSRYGDKSGLDRAVSICRNAIERDVRISDVDEARRIGGGWTVSGRLFDGESFACFIDNDGRVSDISYGVGVASVEDRQYSADRYRLARAEMDGNVAYAQAAPVDRAANSQSAYPGGPIDGDIEYDEEFGG